MEYYYDMKILFLIFEIGNDSFEYYTALKIVLYNDLCLVNREDNVNVYSYNPFYGNLQRIDLNSRSKEYI